MDVARRNDKHTDGHRNEYVSLYSPNTTWGNIISMYLGLPRLRAYWPFSSTDENGNTYDISGNGRTLTRTGTPVVNTYGLITYADLIRLSTHYYTRADEAGIDFGAENLTILGWFNFDAPSTGNITGLVSKYRSAGDVCQYRLWKSATDIITFTVSGDGIAANDDIVQAAAAEYVVDRWLFIAGRFTASTELALFINGTWYTNAVGIPATISPEAISLDIGRTDGAANYYDGQLCHIAMCGYAVPNTMIEALYQHSRAMFGI